jgi:hypothetical protein
LRKSEREYFRDEGLKDSANREKFFGKRFGFFISPSRKMFFPLREFSISGFGMYVPNFGMYVPNFGMYVSDFEMKNTT